MRGLIEKMRMVKGFVMSNYHQWDSSVRLKLNEIAENLVQSVNNKPQCKVFIMLVGYSLSGKSELVKIHPKLRALFRVESRCIHDLLNEAFEFLRDDMTTEGTAYWERQHLTRAVRKKVFELAFNAGLAVVSDSANLKREERRERLAFARSFGYKTVIIYVHCAGVALLNRAKELDKQLIKVAKEPTWVKLYNDQQQRFNLPSEDEADKFYVFESGVDNSDDLNLEI